MVNNPSTNARDVALIPGWGRSPGEGNENPLQYSCLEISRPEEPGRLQSMGPQRVGHNLGTEQQQCTITCLLMVINKQESNIPESVSIAIRGVKMLGLQTRLLQQKVQIFFLKKKGVRCRRTG